ncbi:MAG: hypothetical protein CFE22_07165 [Cytophagaceae bacterium BCCC1]|nr:MAG: hypothetical protein CFE22_07165 [Cytophagaceae bacterium BCCC1]
MDKALGIWGQIDPSAEKYFPIGSRVFAANLPNKFIDPDGREIDVTGMDVYSQVQLLLSLSRITGNNIKIEEGKVVNKGKGSMEGSPKAGIFLDYLISSPQIMYVKSTYSGGSNNKQEKGRVNISLDTYQIEETFQTLGETQGWGLTFLHEALHTGWAAVHFDKEKYDGFEDPVNDKHPNYDPNAIGDTETVVNQFRKELKLVERSSYFNINHYSFDGRLINTTWKFGNKDVEIKPINRLPLFDKIIRSGLSKLNNL